MSSTSLDAKVSESSAPSASVRDRPAPELFSSAVPESSKKSAPRRPTSMGLIATISMLAILAALAGWLLAYAFVFSGWQEHGNQRQLYAQARAELAAQTGPIGGAIDGGAPIAVVQVPALELHDLVVVEGTGAGDLQVGPGHRRDTPLPGQPGTSVIFGRSQLFGAPFGRILELHPGDTITVETGQGVFEYHVDGTRRDGDPAPPALAKGAGRLTLITSEAGSDTGERRAVFVDATLQGDAQPAQPDRPAAVSASETAMASDPGALPLLVVWLEGLVATIVIMAWASSRWSPGAVILLGAPVLLATVWGATQVATQLLPNLV